MLTDSSIKRSRYKDQMQEQIAVNPKSANRHQPITEINVTIKCMDQKQIQLNLLLSVDY